MNNQAVRSLDTLKRIAAFGTAHAADFAAGSTGAAKFATIATALPQLGTLASGQDSGSGAQRAGTTSKAAIYHLLHDDLAAISDTAHVVAETTPGLGLEEKFRLPRSAGNQALLNTARAFATDAAPLKAQFIALELPADFLDHLQTDVAALEAAVGAQKSGQGAHVSATAGLDDTLHTALAAARALGAIVRNKYRPNAAVLAEWATASHIEHPARSAKPAAPVPALK